MFETVWKFTFQRDQSIKVSQFWSYLFQQFCFHQILQVQLRFLYVASLSSNSVNVRRKCLLFYTFDVVQRLWFESVKTIFIDILPMNISQWKFCYLREFLGTSAEIVLNRRALKKECWYSLLLRRAVLLQTFTNEPWALCILQAYKYILKSSLMKIAYQYLYTLEVQFINKSGKATLLWWISI